MAALGWLTNLGFAGGTGVAAPDYPGIEYTLPSNRPHYRLPENRPHYTLPENRPHFEIPGDD